MTKRICVVIVLFCVLILFNCNKDTTNNDVQTLQKYLAIPNEPFNYANPALPAYFSNQFVTIQNNTPADNSITDWGATLGRVLFYDKQLSLNNSISCASCHQQEFGFTDTLQFSLGFNGGHTKRHSMALANASYYLNGRFFWDERAATLEEQVLQPIQDSIEMGMNISSLLQRLQATEYYPILFKLAFDSEEITEQKVAKALAQFVRSMISYKSKFDEGRAQVQTVYDAFPNFTNQENLGKSIYTSNGNVNCFSCHNTEVLITDNPRNNGLYADNQDVGVNINTGNNFDIGKFKAPSLKNVMLRGRYMHDGSMLGILSVIKHYNKNIKANPNLDVHLIDAVSGQPAKMNLNTEEIDALIAFLETLTDHALINDVKYSNPFK